MIIVIRANNGALTEMDVFHVRSAKDTLNVKITRTRNGRAILGLGASLNTS